MASTLRMILFTGGATLTAYLTRLSGDVPDGDGYPLSHSSDVYTASIELEGRYEVRVRETAEGDNIAVGYVDLVEGQTCEPRSTLAELGLAKAEDLAVVVEAVQSLGEGAGPYKLTIPLRDGEGNGVVGALVTIVGSTLKAMSPSTGNVSFNLNGAASPGVTYTVRITAPSGFISPEDMEVTVLQADLTLDPVIVAAQQVVDPGSPAKSILAVKCFDEITDPEPSVKIELVMTRPPAGDTGFAYDSTPQVALSDDDGIATLKVFRGATYQMRRNDSETTKKVVIPDAASSTVSSIIGP